mmetsp:Transcript_130640/g.377899  ORF Transcript_130640/g.377899 Transcript_130640/m.377899 type:complete len:246 (-) Transcript_130640:775-1512(-)
MEQPVHGAAGGVLHIRQRLLGEQLEFVQAMEHRPLLDQPLDYATRHAQEHGQAREAEDHLNSGGQREPRWQAPADHAMKDLLVVRIDATGGQQRPQLLHAGLYGLEAQDRLRLPAPLRATRGCDVAVVPHPLRGFIHLALGLEQVLQRRVGAVTREVVLRQLVRVGVAAKVVPSIPQGQLINLQAKTARQDAHRELRGGHDGDEKHGRGDAEGAQARQLAPLAALGASRVRLLHDENRRADGAAA